MGGSPAYVDWYSGTLEDFKAGLRLGPLSIAFGAADEFMYYDGGIFDGACTSGVNHAMVAIGYGLDDATGLEYIIVRNSWGSNWGVDGYVKIKADTKQGGICELYNYPSYPLSKV